MAEMSVKNDAYGQGRRRGQRKKDQKLAKNAENSTFRGRGATEKRLNNRKKGRKIALLSLYLLYLYHV